MKGRLLLLGVCLCALTAALISCGEYASDDRPAKYPDSVYGKAEYGKDKYN